MKKLIIPLFFLLILLVGCSVDFQSITPTTDTSLTDVNIPVPILYSATSQVGKYTLYFEKVAETVKIFNVNGNIGSCTTQTLTCVVTVPQGQNSYEINYATGGYQNYYGTIKETDIIKELGITSPTCSVQDTTQPFSGDCCTKNNPTYYLK